jgi:hypothetical protein
MYWYVQSAIALHFSDLSVYLPSSSHYLVLAHPIVRGPHLVDELYISVYEDSFCYPYGIYKLSRYLALVRYLIDKY